MNACQQPTITPFVRGRPLLVWRGHSCPRVNSARELSSQDGAGSFHPQKSLFDLGCRKTEHFSQFDSSDRTNVRHPPRSTTKYRIIMPEIPDCNFSTGIFKLRSRKQLAEGFHAFGRNPVAEISNRCNGCTPLRRKLGKECLPKGRASLD